MRDFAPASEPSRQVALLLPESDLDLSPREWYFRTTSIAETGGVRTSVVSSIRVTVEALGQSLPQVRGPK